jgi:glycosyltransferase involved in cell wall biosynthesis
MTSRGVGGGASRADGRDEPMPDTGTSATVARSGIVIVDDYFPDVGTGFRIAEFSWLLKRDVVSEVLTTSRPLSEKIAWYSAAHPLLWQRVHSYDEARLDRHELAYVLFLNNADHYLEIFERLSLPFVVTLYPGGGLYLGDESAEAKIDRVLGSRMLRHVITTQPIVTERVKRSVDTQRVGVTEILGLVVDPEYLGPGPGHRVDYFGSGDERLRLCFVAHRYTADGSDKGFPQFVETVRRLEEAGVPVEGNVVGGFTADDLSPRDRGLPITFFGTLPTVELRAFLARQHVIVSPTKTDTLAVGAFDGFPTGATVEAALAGVAVIASDGRQQNRLFRDGRDIVIVPPDADAIVERLTAVLRRPGELRRIAQAGLATARDGYSVDRQLWARREILQSALDRVRSERDVIDDARE